MPTNAIVDEPALPDQREPGRLDPHAGARDTRATDAIGQMAEHHAPRE